MPQRLDDRSRRFVAEQLEFARAVDTFGELDHQADLFAGNHDQITDHMARFDQQRAGKHGGLAGALLHGGWAFVRCYLLRRGCLDGRLGVVLALYVAEGTYYRYLKLGLLAGPQRRPFD